MRGWKSAKAEVLLLQGFGLKRSQRAALCILVFFFAEKRGFFHLTMSRKAGQRRSLLSEDAVFLIGSCYIISCLYYNEAFDSEAFTGYAKDLAFWETRNQKLPNLYGSAVSMELMMGLEPMTSSLPRKCSTAWATSALANGTTLILYTRWRWFAIGSAKFWCFLCGFCILEGRPGRKKGEACRFFECPVREQPKAFNLIEKVT